MFMAKQGAKSEDNNVWLVDSGCSNLMTVQKRPFKELDWTQKQSLKLGDNKELKVESQGTIAIYSHHGEV